MPKNKKEIALEPRPTQKQLNRDYYCPKWLPLFTDSLPFSKFNLKFVAKIPKRKASYFSFSFFTRKIVNTW